MLQSSRRIAQCCCHRGMLRHWQSTAAATLELPPTSSIITDDVAELVDVSRIHYCVFSGRIWLPEYIHYSRVVDCDINNFSPAFSLTIVARTPTRTFIHASLTSPPYIIEIHKKEADIGKPGNTHENGSRRTTREEARQ